MCSFSLQMWASLRRSATHGVGSATVAARWFDLYTLFELQALSLRSFHLFPSLLLASHYLSVAQAYIYSDRPD